MKTTSTPRLSSIFRAASLAAIAILGLSGCSDLFSDMSVSEDVKYMTIDKANFSGQPTQNANTNNDVKS